VLSRYETQELKIYYLSKEYLVRVRVTQIIFHFYIKIFFVKLISTIFSILTKKIVTMKKFSFYWEVNEALVQFNYIITKTVSLNFILSVIIYRNAVKHLCSLYIKISLIPRNITIDFRLYHKT
jgi:hypothetical protein